MESPTENEQYSCTAVFAYFLACNCDHDDVSYVRRFALLILVLSLGKRSDEVGLGSKAGHPDLWSKMGTLLISHDLALVIRGVPISACYLVWPVS